MSLYVVDASVVAKWFFPEEHSAACMQLLTPDNKLIAPDLMWSEVGNVVWKRSRRGEITSDEVTQLIADLLRMPLETHPTHGLIEAAVEIALGTGITVYDAVYLVLAINHNCQLITADEKLVNGLMNTPFQNWITSISAIR